MCPCFCKCISIHLFIYLYVILYNITTNRYQRAKTLTDSTNHDRARTANDNSFLITVNQIFQLDWHVCSCIRKSNCRLPWIGPNDIMASKHDAMKLLHQTITKLIDKSDAKYQPQWKTTVCNLNSVKRARENNLLFAKNTSMKHLQGKARGKLVKLVGMLDSEKKMTNKMITPANTSAGREDDPNIPSNVSPFFIGRQNHPNGYVLFGTAKEIVNKAVHSISTSIRSRTCQVDSITSCSSLHSVDAHRPFPFWGYVSYEKCICRILGRIIITGPQFKCWKRGRSSWPLLLFVDMSELPHTLRSFELVI